MLNRLLLYLFMLPLLCALTPANASADESIEHTLAMLDAGRYISEEHITVFRFRSLLKQLSAVFVEDEQQIADMTVTAQNLLKEKGIRESLINIMEGMNRIFHSKFGNQKYAEYVVAYVTARNAGQSHTEVIEGLQAILRALGIQ